MLVVQYVLLKSKGSPLLLPAPDVLHGFLHAYAQADARGVGLIPGRQFSISRQLHAGDSPAAGLSVLLAVARGAELCDSPHARRLFPALLHALVAALPPANDHQAVVREGPLCLHAMLLLQQMATWSGDQQSVKASLALWDDGIKLLQANKTLDYRPLDLSPAAEKDESFHLWQQREYQNRLLCAWAINDLEISLLHNTFPKLSLKHIYAAVPESDLLWRTDSPDEWLAAYNHVYGDLSFRNHAYPEPLSHAFHAFLAQDSYVPDDPPQHSVTKLGLLLHPLFALSSHLAQSFDYMFGASDTGSYTCFNASKTLHSRCETLLHKWLRCYRLSLKSKNTSERASAAKYLVLYHLIALNTQTRLVEIERILWRGCHPQSTMWRNAWFTLGSEGDMALILLHCGRVIRLIRNFEYDERPGWWSAALYRVALILCACALVYTSPQTPPQRSSNSGWPPASSPPSITIDNPTLDDARPLDLFGAHGMRMPALTGNGEDVLLLDSLPSILDHFICLVEDMDPHLERSQLTRANLEALKQLWEIPSDGSE
ncbi:hypothetical protein B0J12DRAFT_336948 [Macrophomina phaseolina]|uniref:Transcription factor domain-containing protein n=1 Tax=Macrophomina phaseolina TaxID=35725 RepID=A0ABQ8GLL5_9PEZI|nr:hypothetical protein B0J12DRAFT_336948 [Macrophomina phaseolina]